MKQNINKYIMPFLLWVWGASLWAQTSQSSHILSNNQSGTTKSNVAREKVSMKPGGAYAVTSGQTVNAGIDQMHVFPPTANTYATADGTITDDPTQGGVVGAIPGQFAVSPSGAATYTIPIECPPGINGVQPNISLVYNSQGGDGPLGIGWSISGLSAITRSVKTISSDGAISGFSFTNNDKFALDGNAFYPLNGATNGANQALYETESKTYARIQSFGNLNGLNCPEYFVITSKDGQVVEYGRSGNARIVPGGTNVPFSWLISKITDANGNYMTFTYESSYYGYGDVKIQRIDYTGNGSKIPFARIVFNYNTKSKINTGYIAGYPISDSRILANIQVMSGSTKLKQYDLSYNYQTEKYFLKSIGLTGCNGVKLNDTNVTWGTNNTVIKASKTTIPNYSTSYSEESNKAYTSCDIDGDGRSELVEFFHKNFLGTISNNVRYHKLTTGNGEVSYGQTLQEYELRAPFQFKDLKQDDGNKLFADFNGDGIRCVISPLYQEGNNVKCVSFFVIPSVNRCINHYLSNSSEVTAYTIGDVNNDGKDELISVEKGDGGGKIFYVKKTTNNNSSDLDESDNVLSNAFSPTMSELENKSPQQLILYDFNSDGLKDIFVLTKGGGYFYKNNGGKLEDGIVQPTFSYVAKTNSFNSDYSTIRVGDFNGDGLIDFVLNEHCNNVWKLAINNGKWGFDFTSLPNITASNDDLNYRDDSKGDVDDGKDDCVVVDLNNDGKSDVILIDADYGYNDNIFENPWGTYKNTRIKWMLSTGAGFTILRDMTINDENFTYNQFNCTGDFDGDGREEVLTYGSNLYNGISKDSDLHIYSSFNTKFEANLVTMLTDGLNNSTFFDYQPLTYPKTTDNKDFYVKGSGSTYPIVDLQIPLYCLKYMSQSGPIANNYTYKGLQAQVAGKGLLGFKNLIATNTVNSTKVVSTTEMDYTLCLPTKVTTETSLLTSGSAISKSETTFANTKNGYVYQSLPLKSIETDYLTGLTKTTENKEYDSDGNLTVMETKQGDLTETKTIEYNKFGSWAWAKNKPTQVTTMRVQNGESDTRVISYDYDTNTGNLIKETKNPTDPFYKVTTECQNFDQFGHATTVKVSADAKMNGTMTSRTSSLVYYPSGRFVQSKTNNLGETTTYLWDELLCQLNSETDYRNRTTSYIYNGLGQLTEKINPDGTRNVSVLQWVADGIDEYSAYDTRYYKYTQSSGTAPEYIWYDATGREVFKDVYGLNGKRIRTLTRYRWDGKVDKVSQPTFGPVDENWEWAAEYSYDDPYGRVSSVKTPMGTISTTYDGKTTTVASPEGTKTTILNSSGQIQTVTTNGKSVSYIYNASGLAKTSTPDGGQSISMEYDLLGNRIKLTDPDAGVVESKYNGFGELLWERQKVHKPASGQEEQIVWTSNTYDEKTGLLQNILRENKKVSGALLTSEKTEYAYDNYKRVQSIKIAGKHEQTFAYDDFDRVTSVTENVGARSYTQATVYDALGREDRHIYPSGYYTYNVYDIYGNLTEVKDKDERSIWKAEEENARGQLTRISKGGKETSFTFDNRGLPVSITASGVFDASYLFDSKGNLQYRTDNLTGQREEFAYDTHNRLTNWNTFSNGVQTKANSITYDGSTGSITNKSDLGNFTMTYGANGKPHALTGIEGRPDAIPAADLNVTYTDFKKIKTLSEGDKYYTLDYGVDDQRRKSEYKVNGVTQETRYYLGDYEEVVDANGNTKRIHYISGGDGIAAIYEMDNNGNGNMRYAYTDFQGSLMALTDVNGNTVERYAYDPWGLRRNPDDWSQKDTRTSWLTNRGYTGHEHIDAFGIINMNGRVYDPLTAVFLSPDPYIQSPEDWLNYNRYQYCLNNPFRYIDPTGYSFWSKLGSFLYAAAAVVVTVFNPPLGAAMIGAYVGGSIANKNLDLGKWNYSNENTYLGILGGAAVGLVGTMAVGAALQNSLVLKLGVDLGGIAKATADFAIVGGKIAMQGIGYSTIAGGGAYLTYTAAKEILNGHPDNVKSEDQGGG